MSDLLAARSQMAMWLGFHIIFASIGIAMPLLMVIAEGLWLRSAMILSQTRQALGQGHGGPLRRRCGLGESTLLRTRPALAALHGVGRTIDWYAVLAEGFAFFTEAIFLGIYLYGWTGLGAGALVRWLDGRPERVLSGIFVVMANAWMNQPTGFDLVDGEPVNRPRRRNVQSRLLFGQTLHMTIAAFLGDLFAVAAIHTALLRREPGSEFHRKAIAIALSVGVSPLPSSRQRRHQRPLPGR